MNGMKQNNTFAKHSVQFNIIVFFPRIIKNESLKKKILRVQTLALKTSFVSYRYQALPLTVHLPSLFSSVSAFSAASESQSLQSRGRFFHSLSLMR